jgi:hypothetical protein
MSPVMKFHSGKLALSLTLNLPVLAAAADAGKVEWTR